MCKVSIANNTALMTHVLHHFNYKSARRPARLTQCQLCAGHSPTFVSPFELQRHAHQVRIITVILMIMSYNDREIGV